MKWNRVKTWSAERISYRVLYGLVGLVAVVFAAFALIGFNHPYEDNPDLSAPLLTDALLVLMYLFFLVAAGACLWSVWKSLKFKGERIVNGIPIGKIASSVALGTLLLLVITFVFGSSDPIMINGKPFETWAWLKLSDMFVSTSLILIVVAVATVVYGNMKYIRKKHV